VRAFLKRSGQILGALAIFLSAVSHAADGVDTADLGGGVKLQLNGIGIARELSGELYIAALYGDSRTNNADYFLRNDVPKRMAMRVVADKLYGRRFGQMWRERILINNDRKLVQDLTEEVLEFVEAFSFNMVSGDQIHFDFVPSKGTRITVNNAEVMTVKKPECFALLLRTWTGERAPSVEFRKGVLGESDAATAIAVQERFALLKPTPARIAETRSQLDKKPAAAVVEAPAPAVAAAKVEPKKEEPKKPEPKKEEVKPVAIAAAPTVAPPAAKPAETPAPKKEEPKVIAKAETPAAPQGGDKASVTAIDGTELATVDKKEPSASDKLAEYRARRDYERLLLGHIGQFKEYPWNRLRRKYGDDVLYNPKQGKAIVRVTLTRDGSVKGSQIEQSTGEKILDEAALSMVEKAAPLPGIPSKLADEEFEFLVEVMMSAGRLEQ
jgi:TonB family protein